MRAKWPKLVGLVVAVAAMAVVVTYAEKGQEAALPTAVKAVLAEIYPNAVLAEAKAGEGLTVYEVELEQAGGDIELTLAPDGTVLESETEISLDELDPVVKKAIVDAAEAQGAKIEEVKKEVTEWVVTLKKLDVPESSYEAELVRDGQKIELKVAAGGAVLEQKGQPEDDDDQDADEVED
jgi:hypothetical protein